MTERPPPRVIERPPPPGVLAGVDEAMIHRLVHGFYDRIRADEVLGPIFSSEISDWEPHLAKMVDFWSSVVLMTRRYDGRPVPAHVKIPGLDRAHFSRWLTMFEATARELCPPAAADLFIDRAHRIAQSLQLSLDFHRGILPPLKAPIRAG
ncbi:MAG: group III truncated hemoglobin [Beijerinckiaceae bacterium]|nr:group III truncated hemoglobin [Beijerinckiaceae bacterium]MDO9440562.1 group III truncated hemoglobin [Beijerinckiaceae bacterium]